MKLSDVFVFNKVASTLSFTRAGQLLGLSRSAVSKRISRLERDTGVVLFQRSPRTIRLTAAGERFLDHTSTLDETMDRAKEALRNTNNMPWGTLKFTMPTSLGASFVPLLLREFQREFPEVDLAIDLSENYVDLIADGFDVAIRVAQKMPDSSLMSRRLCTSPAVLVASPAYIRNSGSPTRLEELRFHRCLTSMKGDSVWRLIGPAGPTAVRPERVTTFSNDLALILAAVLDGGILLAPRILVESEISRGQLEPILTDYRTKRQYGVFAVYPNRNPPPNVSVFIEFVEGWLPRIGEHDRWNPLNYFASPTA